MFVLPTWMAAIGLLALLAWLSRVDWRTHRLPNIGTIGLLALGLVWAWGAALDFYPHLLGAALGYGVFWVVEVAYRLIRKRDGLGRGDAKLLAAGGAWCGAWALPAIVLVGSVAALVYVVSSGKRSERIAFGPFLSLGIAAVWIIQRLV